MLGADYRLIIGQCLIGASLLAISLTYTVSGKRVDLENDHWQLHSEWAVTKTKRILLMQLWQSIFSILQRRQILHKSLNVSLSLSMLSVCEVAATDSNDDWHSNDDVLDEVVTTYSNQITTTQLLLMLLILLFMLLCLTSMQCQMVTTTASHHNNKKFTPASC